MELILIIVSLWATQETQPESMTTLWIYDYNWVIH